MQKDGFMYDFLTKGSVSPYISPSADSKTCLSQKP